MIEALGLTEDEFQKMTQLELATVSVQLSCPKWVARICLIVASHAEPAARCKNTVLVDRTDHQQTEIFACPMNDCDNLWCKMCMQTVASRSASDHSCDGTKELDRLMNTTGWKRCPVTFRLLWPCSLLILPCAGMSNAD